MEIAKTYSPADIEDKWYEAWMQANLFRSVPDSRPAYTIVIPPPNVTGVLHMGHMLNNTIQDVLIRRKRMEGFNACWVPGTDHASIATEAKVVKLLAEQGIKKTDIGREKFLEHAFEWKEKYGGIILQQLRKLGASCDWERTRFTMDTDYYRDVINAFCELYDQGYIYRGVRMVNWDPSAKTAVSDEEVIRKETRGKLVYIRYRFEDDPSQYLTVATVRPETIMGDVAICVHPEDERYTHLVGKRVIVPLINRAVPIITDTYIDREFGTGCLKVTPAHDINDYEIGMKYNLPVIDVFNEDGTISEAGQLYVGMDRFAVRKKIIADMEAADLVEKVEDYTNQVGYSERTDAAIEPRLSLQWFLKMKDLSQPALDAVLNGEVNLIPEKYGNTYRYWMENVRDWCLSRQLWWGHQIPAYYIQGTNDFVVAPSAEEALEKAKAKTGNANLQPSDLTQDPDVLDTWASSWLWPISVFDGMEHPDNEEFTYYYPTNDLVTAPEILFFWVARMIIAGKTFANGTSPFQNVYLTGIVRDKQRRKMSKSLGNSPDPLELIAQFGADGVRMGMLLCSPAGNDILYDDALVEQGRNFSNKVWNAFRLVKGWEESLVDRLDSARRPENPDSALPHLDIERSRDAQSTPDAQAIAWMQARIAQAAAELADGFTKFRLSEVLMTVYKLIWDDFCSNFLEMVKPPYGQSMEAGTHAAVLDLFEDLMHLLHPFMPFLSEEVWQGLRPREAGSFLAVSQLSETLKGAGATEAQHTLVAEMALVQEAITEIRAFRSRQKGLSPHTLLPMSIKADALPVLGVYLPLVTKMANVSPIEAVTEKPAGTAGTAGIRVRAYELYLPLGDINVDEERAKLNKEIEYAEGFLKSVATKLSNEKFVANAKPEAVDNERRKQADAEAKLVTLRAALAELG